MAKLYHIEVDASDLQEEINRLKEIMTPERFNQCMHGIFNRVPGHVRKILRQDLPHDYHVRAGHISSAVSGGKVTTGVGGVGCTIPIRDRRGLIGGRYRASGGAHGWAPARNHRKYRVKARIVKAGQSVLPQNMPANYGGYPPFRNFSAPKLNGGTYTRTSKARLPIRKVPGIAIPQMPMNRSEAEVQNDIKQYLEQRMEHEFMRLIGGS